VVVVPVQKDTTAYTDSATLPFAESFLRVLEKATALELLAKMTDEDRVRLGLNPNVAAEWKPEIESGIRYERIRVQRMKRGTYGVGAVVS